MVLFPYVLEARGAWWIVEQPTGSLLSDHPRFQQFIASVDVWSHTAHMGMFGSATRKPTWLFSNRPCVGEIDRLPLRWWCSELSESNLYETINGQDRRSVNGVHAALKESQHYPAAFGHAVAAVHAAHASDLQITTLERNRDASACVRIPDVWNIPADEDTWEDAHTASVLEFLTAGKGHEITGRNKR